MKEFFENLVSQWWGILIISIVCVAVWVLLSALLYKPFFKRFYDMLLSGIAIIVFSPLLLILIILGAIKMKGNPFFTQFRPGKRKKLSKKQCSKLGVPYGIYGEEKVFKLIKFRTMTCEKDEHGELLPDEKRLTKYGKFLRSTSLDELPELFNIFIGQMSIVGPRPLLVRYLPVYTVRERHRHDVRPGLTGLAQINGRNYISWEKIFEYDIEYKEKCSFFFDIKIIILTAYKVIKKEDITSVTQGGGNDDSGRRVYAAFDIERKKQNERTEIGSNFWQYNLSVKENELNTIFSNNGNIALYKSGRNAIKALCRILKNTNKKVLLPIYTCSTVIEPFIDECWEIAYYDINKNLGIEIDNLKSIVDSFNPGVVYLQSYFGFDTLHSAIDCIRELKTRGIIVVEDVTHSLLSVFNRTEADYYVASLRKFFAIPCGGFIQSKENVQILEKKCCDLEIDELAVNAFEMKRKYLEELDQNVDKKDFREAFNRLDDKIRDNAEIEDISPLSLKILKSAEVAKIGDMRRENFNYLLSNISFSIVKNIFDSLNEKIIPLIYPIFIDTKTRRDELQKFLCERKIYCPILWPISENKDCLTENAVFIFNHILCVPIDQRYTKDDMEKIVEAIKEFAQKNGEKL